MKAITTKEDQEQFLRDFIKFWQSNGLNYESCYKPFVDSLNKPVEGWYKDKRQTTWMMFIENGTTKYGFDIHGKWFDTAGSYKLQENDYPATPDEVLERLSEFAREKGYKAFEFYMNERNEFCMLKTKDVRIGNIIMKDGIWAEIIEDKRDNSSAIKVLERSKALIEEQIKLLK